MTQPVGQPITSSDNWADWFDLSYLAGRAYNGHITQAGQLTISVIQQQHQSEVMMPPAVITLLLLTTTTSLASYSPPVKLLPGDKTVLLKQGEGLKRKTTRGQA